MQHIWIIQKDTGVMMFYHPYNSEPFDGFLVSGLLAALNVFSELQITDQGIESIDMGNLRWVYSTQPYDNLLFIAADSKDSNANLTLSRVDVIRNFFIQSYGINNDFWKKGIIDIQQFEGFRTNLDLLKKQWDRAGHVKVVGKLFDLWGIFQQIFIKFIKITEDNFQGEKFADLLQDLSKYMGEIEHLLGNRQLFLSYRVIEIFIPRIDLATNSITFNPTEVHDLMGLNPEGLDQENLIPIFYIVITKFVEVLRLALGIRLWHQTINDTFMPYFFEKWEFLERFGVLKDLMQIFFR